MPGVPEEHSIQLQRYWKGENPARLTTQNKRNPTNSHKHPCIEYPLGRSIYNTIMPCDMLSKFMTMLRLENSLLQAGADITITVVTDNPKMARNPASQRHYESPSRPIERSRWEEKSNATPPRTPTRRIASLPSKHINL
jgi:hypothetical protein